MGGVTREEELYLQYQDEVYFRKIIAVTEIHRVVQISENLRYLYFQAEVQLRGECGRSYERGGAIPEVPG